jgi:hypothetical protein
MPMPFGPHPAEKPTIHINKDPAPIRKRKDYMDLATKLGEAISDLLAIADDPNGRYQAETEALQELGIASYRLMKYIEKNAWDK